MQIFVKNLVSSVTNEQLLEFFEQWGEIDNARVIVSRDTGASRGFGFVSYFRARDARRAIQSANGCRFHDAVLFISETMSRETQSQILKSKRIRRREKAAYWGDGHYENFYWRRATRSRRGTTKTGLR